MSTERNETRRHLLAAARELKNARTCAARASTAMHEKANEENAKRVDFYWLGQIEAVYAEIEQLRSRVAKIAKELAR